jgi:hypothetical protein
MDLAPVLVIAVLFAVPLGIGAVVTSAGYRRSSFRLKTIGLLIGPVLFLVGSYLLFMTAAGQRICGTAGALALIIVVAGSVLELAGALVVTEVIASRARRRAMSA